MHEWYEALEDMGFSRAIAALAIAEAPVTLEEAVTIALLLAPSSAPPKEGASPAAPGLGGDSPSVPPPPEPDTEAAAESPGDPTPAPEAARCRHCPRFRNLTTKDCCVRCPTDHTRYCRRDQARRALRQVSTMEGSPAQTAGSTTNSTSAPPPSPVVASHVDHRPPAPESPP